MLGNRKSNAINNATPLIAAVSRVLFCRHALVFLVVGVMAGCAAMGAREAPPAIYWPPAPEKARLVYEATLRSVDTVTGRPTATDRLQSLATGDASGDQPGMDKPYDVAARNGLVVVSDTRAALVYVYDLARGRVFPIGWRGEGKLVRPSGVAIDEHDRIYVADAGRNVVVVYDGFGLFLKTVGVPAEFDRLVDVAVSPDGERVYALDRGDLATTSHQVRLYDASGVLLKTFGGRGAEVGKLNNPAQLAVASSGEVYVLDAGNFRIQIFSANGDFVRMWGRAGQVLGDFARPRGLAVDQQGRVYVTDAAFQNVQLFDGDGRLLLTLGEVGPDGPGKFALPGGVAVDTKGHVFIVDQLFRKVEVWRMLE